MKKIGVIGLGYVGLPLAVLLSKKFKVIAYDISTERIDQLHQGIDLTREVLKKEIHNQNITYTSDNNDLLKCNFYIVTVPTPINNKNIPDLTLIKKATYMLSKIIKKGDIVVYESTVYPGLTEEIILPILKKNRKLIFNKDFFIGYSPERVNPGDKKHRIENIKKIISGSNNYALGEIKSVYGKIIKAGLHICENIKTAEAAKIIENIQRDANIALINEFSKIFYKLGLNTQDVLKASSTKWNFLNFSPGLVGGHCIGVDPYYLTYKAKKIGINSKMILAGRSTNNDVIKDVFFRVQQLMYKKKINLKKANILIMGATFKENCPDIRNSKSIELYKLFKKNFDQVHLYDPLITNGEIESKLIRKLGKNKYSCIVIAVAHKKFKEMGIKKIKKLGKKNVVIFDIKSIFDKRLSDGQL